MLQVVLQKDMSCNVYKCASHLLCSDWTMQAAQGRYKADSLKIKQHIGESQALACQMYLVCTALRPVHAVTRCLAGSWQARLADHEQLSERLEKRAVLGHCSIVPCALWYSGTVCRI